MDMTDCDCSGPAARVNGECRVLVETRATREAQERHARVRDDLEGYRRAGVRVSADMLAATLARHGADREGIERLERDAGLTPLSELTERRREEREREGDPQGMEWRLQRLGVPTKALIDLRSYRADFSPTTSQAADAARKFLQAPGEWCPFLALLGDVGLGKTVAAAWVFRELARRTSADLPTGSAEPLVWVQGPLFTRMSAFSSDDDRALERCRAAKLLVIDELGDESTALGISTVRDLCMARESAGRRTIITSNANPAAFEMRYGKALWDRLGARGIVTGLKGKSLRSKGWTP